MARKQQTTAESTLRFTSANLWLALAAISLILVGYHLLARGSVTLAPALLVFGYVLVLPLAIVR